MLGMLPDIKDAPQINAELEIPLQPGRPPNAFALGPWNENLTKAAERTPLGFRPDMPAPDATAQEPHSLEPRNVQRTQRELRHETAAAHDHRQREAEARRLIGARVVPAFAVH